MTDPPRPFRDRDPDATGCVTMAIVLAIVISSCTMMCVIGGVVWLVTR